MLVDGAFFLLSDASSENTHYTRPPLVSSDPTEDITVSLCLGAMDKYNAVAESCLPDQTVKNKIAHIDNYAETQALLLGLDFTSANLTSVLFASNVLYFSMKQPYRLPINPGICTLDHHCNSNGNCNARFGI
jgi:hypothetical protein